MFTNMHDEVVASHGSIHIRARGWCDNGGVSVKDGKMANCLELKSIFIPFCLKFPAQKFKADCLPMWQI